MTKLSNVNFEASISGCFLKRAIHKMQLYCETIEYHEQLWSMEPQDLAPANCEIECIKEDLVEKMKKRTVC